MVGEYEVTALRLGETLVGKLFNARRLRYLHAEAAGARRDLRHEQVFDEG